MLHHRLAGSAARPQANRDGRAVNISLYDLSVWVLPLVLAITFHEAAHAFVAYRLGDDTAWQLGRVSFNPLRHIDPFGTVILPAMLLFAHSPFLFGYAKPVPVNFRKLNHPRLDMVWVALAGPATNILLALAAALALHALPLAPAASAGTKGKAWKANAAAKARMMLMTGPASATQTMSSRGWFRLRKFTGTGLA